MLTTIALHCYNKNDLMYNYVNNYNMTTWLQHSCSIMA